MKKLMTDIEVKEVLVELLKEFVDFCEKHNLRYSLDGGTLIGAIRHNGFIPWDDDIDVMMPREDYEYFKQNFKSDTSFFLDNDVNKYYHLPVGKIISNKTYGYEKGYKKFRKYGVFLDIFPLDRIPLDPRIYYEYLFINKRLADKILIMSSKYCYSWDYPRNIWDGLRLVWLIPFALIRTLWYRGIVGYRGLFHKIDNDYCLTRLNKSILNKKNYIKEKQQAIRDNKYCFMYWGDYKYSDGFSPDDFNEYLTVLFEGVECRIIKSYDKYLSSFYSINYMQLPPPEDRIKAHTSIFYWKKSYLKELKKGKK